jgi:hypothetical protein
MTPCLKCSQRVLESSEVCSNAAKAVHARMSASGLS